MQRLFWLPCEQARLQQETRARGALEVRVTGLEESAAGADYDGVVEVLETLETKVREAEQLFGAGMAQSDSVEAQLHKLEATVARELGIRSGPTASARDLTATTLPSEYSDALRSSSAEELEQLVRKASTPTRRAPKRAGSRRPNAEDEHAAILASMKGLLGHETAEAICEAFAGVIKELRANVDDMAHAGAATTAVAELEHNHDLLRRDLQSRSDKLGEGVENVLQQLQQVSAFAAKTDALRNVHDETLRRVQQLEDKLGKDREDRAPELERRYEALHAELEETSKTIDDISHAVAHDLERLDAKDSELSDRLQALSGVELQELQTAQFAADEALAEQGVKIARLERVLQDQVGSTPYRLL